MDQRILAAVMIAVLGCFLYVSSINLVHVVADREFGAAALLLFCVIACVGWIVFLAALALAEAPGRAPLFRKFPRWRPAMG